MKTLALTAVVAVSFLPLAACDSLIGLIQPNSVAVRLINNADFPVDVEVYVHNDQNVLESIITEVGERLEYTIGAGETVSFSRSCDDLQAIIIDDADLQVIGGAGPEANTDVLRDGDDFGCGGTLTFTFDHSASVLDFDVTFSAVR